MYGGGASVLVLGALVIVLGISTFVCSSSIIVSCGEALLFRLRRDRGDSDGGVVVEAMK